jgi:NADPH:quinone reductase-like Zn-dependent oxidoreductase
MKAVTFAGTGGNEVLSLAERPDPVPGSQEVAAAVSLRALMGKRATMRGTALRARPLEEKAAAVRVFARTVVPLLAAGRALPDIDRVIPAEQVTAAFDYLAKPCKTSKVLLEFA